MKSFITVYALLILALASAYCAPLTTNSDSDVTNADIQSLIGSSFNKTLISAGE